MKSILIIGSGIVGICTGIELIKRGYTVTLMDPNKYFLFSQKAKKVVEDNYYQARIKFAL